MATVFHLLFSKHNTPQGDKPLDCLKARADSLSEVQ